MSEKTGGFPTMWDCHTTPPQLVDLALDGRPLELVVANSVGERSSSDS